MAENGNHAMDMDKSVWVVLFCSRDDSHVLVDHTAVVYHEELKDEAEVYFAFPGIKKKLLGVIKGFSEDREAMVELQDRLNVKTKPTRQPSFDAGRPRKAAVKCKQGFASTIKKKGKSPANDAPANKGQRGANKSKSASKTKQPLKRIRPAKQTLDTSEESSDTSSSSSDEEAAPKSKPSSGEKLQNSGKSESLTVNKLDCSDSESSDEEMTEEELKVLEKLAKRKRLNDFKDLLALNTNKMARTDSSSTPACLPKISTPGGGHTVKEPDCPSPNLIHAVNIDSSSTPACLPKISTPGGGHTVKEQDRLSRHNLIHALNISPNGRKVYSPLHQPAPGTVPSQEISDNGMDSFEYMCGDLEVNLLSESVSTKATSLGNSPSAKIVSSMTPSVSKGSNASDKVSSSSIVGVPKIPEPVEKQDGKIDSINLGKRSPVRLSAQPKEVENKSNKNSSKSNKKPKKGEKEYIYIKYDGEFYNHTEEDYVRTNTVDEANPPTPNDKKKKKKEGKVVKLREEYDVFLLESDLKRVKNVISPSRIARALVRSIFKLEAREKCSPMGKPSLEKGMAKSVKRTPLHPDGVLAITEYVQHRAAKKQVNVPTESQIKQFMANVLCEDRAAARLATEASDASLRASVDEEGLQEENDEVPDSKEADEGGMIGD